MFPLQIVVTGICEDVDSAIITNRAGQKNDDLFCGNDDYDGGGKPTNEVVQKE